ncbi:MAG: hypothetical protein EOO30_05275 [Comamonadaceae bacterium]|nr:MAG: hypothetical protein EOO30_05275 [Comamonadaceae bacterium]
MCHVVRDENALPRPDGAGALPTGETRRPRWLVGAAVMMAGGLAVAGWLDLQAGDTNMKPDPVLTQAAAAPVAARSVPETKGPTEGALLVNDEVPTAPGELRKAAGGHCEYGL